jgi:peptidyl-prolyl cis-trans isomerase SurA
MAVAEYTDKVLVIVNEDVITQSEFEYRLQSVMAELQRSDAEKPEDLEKQLLDGMVSDRLQIQEAERRGITVTDQELASAIERFAGQQKLTLDQFSRNLAASGQPIERFAETVRESLTISRLTDYYARARVIVPDYEIDGFIAANKLDEDASEYEIAHLLIKNPDKNIELAQRIRKEIANGLSFQEAVLTYSEGIDGQEGGRMGWRTAAQLPEVFLNAIKDVQVGGVTPVLESSNGLHILKLLDLKGDRTEIVQSNVRHILITAESKVAKSQASKKLFNIRQRILDGEDFEQLARIYSDDSVSAANGGSLDWVSPGQMVKEFEAAYTQLPLMEVSQPIESQFGVHILRVEDRRKKNITDQMIRNRADGYLRRQRADREFNQWVRELREQAYVEFVSEST